MTDYKILEMALRCNDWDSSCPCDYKHLCNGTFSNCLIFQAADAIEELCMKLSGDEAAIAGMKRELQRQLFISAEHNPRWISTSEYLPDCEYGAEVGNVVFRIGDYVYAGCFGVGGRQRDKYFRTWTDGTEGWDAKDVDAWFIPKGC